jgi:predicted ester cyclase
MTAREMERNVTLSRLWIDECVNAQRTDIVTELFHPQYEGHSPPHAEPLPLAGPQGYKRFIDGILKGFPDAHATIDDVYAAGDKVTLRVGMTGTHLGAYRGIPPTRRPFAISQIVILRMEDGKIRESWQEIDALGMMIQLGVAPAPGTTPPRFLAWALGTMVRFAAASIRTAQVQQRIGRSVPSLRTLLRAW